MRHFAQSIGVAFGLVVVALLLYADSAYAAGGGTVGSFSCSAGHASGQMYNSGGSCPTTLTMGHLFSFLVCNMEQLASNLMGHMYCGMIKSLEPVVWTTATLAVTLFGISFTIGLTPATSRDAMVFLLKLSFVVAFATNADFLIGIGYKLLISGIKDGVSIVLSGLGGDMKTGDDVFAALDKFLAEAFHFATDSVGVTNAADRCKNAIFAVLATMAVAFPLLAYLGLLLLARIVITFLRAVFGYVYAIVGITFLMVLAPFFIIFYLFKETKPFFDKWLGYLVSFALQAILLFAGLAFILMIPAKNLTAELPNVIMPVAQTFEATSFRFPWQYCTLCDFKIVDKDSPGVELTDKSPNFISNGKMVCKEPREPITATFAVAPKPKDNTSTSTPAPSMSQLSALLMLAGNGILALIVLAVVVERLLAQLPYLAQKIASGLGVAYAPQIGGGHAYGGGASLAMPGDTLGRDFGAGFQQGFPGGKGLAGDGISSSMRGVREGFAAMATGKTTGGQVLKDEAGNAIGLANRFPWLGIKR